MSDDKKDPCKYAEFQTYCHILDKTIEDGDCENCDKCKRPAKAAKTQDPLGSAGLAGYVCVIVVNGEAHSVYEKNQDSSDAVGRLEKLNPKADVRQYRCLVRRHT